MLLELDHANASNPSTRPSFSLKQVTSSYNIPQLDENATGEAYSSEDDEAVDAPLAEGALKSPPVGRAMNDSDEDEESAGPPTSMQMLAALSPQDCRGCHPFRAEGASASTASAVARSDGYFSAGARGKPSKTPTSSPLNASDAASQRRRQQQQMQQQQQQMQQQQQQMQQLENSQGRIARETRNSLEQAQIHDQ